MFKSLIFILPLLAVTGSSGAVQARKPRGVAKSVRPAKAAKAVKSASIIGYVSYRGKAPTPAHIDTSSDAACGPGRESDTLIVSKKGRLQDVHVRIKSGSVGKYESPTTPVVISQQGCTYSPHVVGAMVGQPIAIANHDPTMHNVHAYIGGDTWFNRSQPKNAPDIVERDTGKAGEVFRLACDVHSWMRSYVPITDHPYFDVSGADGTFAINNVPAGTYTVEAWHPILGLKSKQVKVGKHGGKVSFSFP